MAEALFRQSLSAVGHSDCVVSSAGLGALIDYEADPQSCALMTSKGLDISNHRARQLDKALVREADLILVMESVHKQAIEDHMPSAKGKVFRLGEWGGFDIPDPYRKDNTAFLTALALIERGVSEWVKKI